MKIRPRSGVHAVEVAVVDHPVDFTIHGRDRPRARCVSFSVRNGGVFS